MREMPGPPHFGVVLADQHIVPAVRFRLSDRADETAGGDVSFDQRLRRDSDTEPVNRRLQLEMNMLHFDMAQRQEIGMSCRRQPLRPGRARRRRMEQRVPPQILDRRYRAVAQQFRAAGRQLPILHQNL
jgi:hypothetical protein